MATDLLMTCNARYKACASRPVRPRKPTLRTRLTTFVIALAALSAMFAGERWMLQHSPTAANELIVATCAADVVFGDAHACTSTAPSNTKEKAQ